jgi:hypothetical protein
MGGMIRVECYTSMMHVDLVVPDWVLPVRGGMIDPYRELQLTHLPWLLGRAHVTRRAGSSLDAWLCNHFGMAATPSAALSMLADQVGAQGQTVLRADPVHLQAQRDQLVLIDAGQLKLQQAEANELIAALNTHFLQHGLRFQAPVPTRWYASFDAPLEVQTDALAITAGHSINHRLPRGRDGLRLHQLANEIQMLLHTHPVNAARETAGQAAINSVWFWGEGARPNVAPRHDVVWTNHAVARGLARAAATPLHPLPDSAESVLADGGTRHLIVWDALQAPIWYGDYDTWRARLAELDARWLGPLRDALTRGRIRELDLYAPCASVTWHWQLTPGARWSFWRRPRALKQFSA